MKIEFIKLGEVLKNQNKDADLAEYIEVYEGLNKRKVPKLKVIKGHDFGELKRIKEMGVFVRQVLLHRVIKLVEGSFSAAIQDNFYVVALTVRGSYETTGAIGYLHSKLSSFRNGKIEAEVVDKDITNIVMASKDMDIAPNPINILTMLDYADKVIGKELFKNDEVGYPNMVRGSYEYLCEFCHPNFHSNLMSFHHDKVNEEYVFRGEGQFYPAEFNVLGHILISAPLFIRLFDGVGKICKEL